MSESDVNIEKPAVNGHATVNGDTNHVNGDANKSLVNGSAKSTPTLPKKSAKTSSSPKKSSKLSTAAGKSKKMGGGSGQGYQWTPHKRRGPIAAEFSGPGPAAIALPSLIGSKFNFF